MKRFVCIVCLLACLLSAYSCAKNSLLFSKSDATHGIYRLTFKAKELSNDSVGDDWCFTYTYNGKQIQSGYLLTYSLSLFTYLPIDVEVREKDKADDIGTGTLRVAICDGGSGKTEIAVTETSGKYKGHTAVWEITCKARLVGTT